jgi:hypothetical protein
MNAALARNVSVPIRLSKILGALIALKIIILFTFAWHSRFVMDEFVWLGNAKYLFRRFFDTLWPAKTVGYALFYKLAHVSGWDAASILLIGRVQTALLGCAILALVYACARALGEDRPRALAIILVLLCFSNFMERVFRTIAEPLAVFFAVAALLVIVRGQADRSRTLFVAGLLSGLSFLATQKAVYFNVALGVALLADAAVARRYFAGMRRGVWLVLGWGVAILAYCFAFGGFDPLPVAKSIVFGPVEVATRGGVEYGGLRRFVLQTLVRNPILYFFCFAGLGLGLAKLGSLNGPKRIALLFSAIITALVFAHDQPWPYVFLMTLPFLALWSLELLDRVSGNPRQLRFAVIALATAVALSFVSNIRYFRFDNASQLELVTRAEALIRPGQAYFDGVGMLPNRSEPTTLWLDRYYVLATLREGKRSEVYRALTRNPPKIILWSYRMDDISPVVGSLIRDSYVRVAPNIRMAGRELRLGEEETFTAPIAGAYRLYNDSGEPLDGQVEVDGELLASPIQLDVGTKVVTLQTGPRNALLLPEGPYRGVLSPGPDNERLFANVYD